MWRQPSSGRGLLPHAAFDASAITGRIRAITEDAKRHVEASVEAARLLE